MASRAFHRGEQPLDAELDARAYEIEHLIELVGRRADRLRDVCTGCIEQCAACRTEPAHDRRAMHAIHLCELLERDTAEQVQAQQVAIAPLERFDGDREAGDERLAVLRLDQRQLDIAGGRELVTGGQLGLAIFEPNPIDRGARRGDLDQTTQALFRYPRPVLSIDPDLTVLVRKAWDIGLEEVLFQTVIQVDGDVVVRVAEMPDTESRTFMATLHRTAVDDGLKQWHLLFKVVGDLVSGIGQWLFGRSPPTASASSGTPTET